jgi:hypothetical protein
MVSCFPLLGQDKDSLTLPREVRLNERQPPDLVLKTIGIKPGRVSVLPEVEKFLVMLYGFG